MEGEKAFHVGCEPQSGDRRWWVHLTENNGALFTLF